MASSSEKVSPKKEKKVVQYPFGTPTHGSAFSAFAHITNSPNLDFAKALAQNVEGESREDDSPKKKKRASSEAAPPLIKIDRGENPCQRKDCKDVIKALLSGQHKVAEEKEEIMDELDHLNADLKEIELLFSTLDDRQNALVLEKRQLEGLSEQQTEKLKHLEETKKTLQHERDSFGQTSALLESEKNIWASKARESRKKLADLMWRGKEGKDEEIQAHMHIKQTDAETIEQEDSASMVPYDDLTRKDIIDFSERKKIHHDLPDYLEPNNVANLESLTDEQLSFMRISSSKSLNTLYTSPISMTRSRTSVHTPDLFTSRASFLAGNAHTYSTAHRTLRRGSNGSMSVDGGGSTSSRNNNDSLLGSRLSFLTGSPNTISALTSLKNVATAKSPSVASVTQSPAAKLLSPVHALKTRRKPGKYSPTPHPDPLPNDVGYKGYMPSGSCLHRAGGSITDHEFSRGSLGGTTVATQQHHRGGGGGGGNGLLHYGSSPPPGDSLVGGHTMSTISVGSGGSMGSDHDTAESLVGKLDPVFYREKTRSSWGHKPGIVGKLREKTEFAEGEYGVEVKNKYLTFRHPAKTKFGMSLAAMREELRAYTTDKNKDGPSHSQQPTINSVPLTP